MKDEIKEILDYLKDEDEYYKKAEEIIVGYGDLIVEKEDIDKLLDYITNLQEENKNFKEYAKNYLKSKTDRKNEELELAKTKLIEEHNKCYDLRKENERLIQETTLLSNKLIDMTRAKEDYKSRCEKAGEMIQFIAFNNERPLTMTELNKVYYILEGDDNNESR